VSTRVSALRIDAAYFFLLPYMAKKRYSGKPDVLLILSRF